MKKVLAITSIVLLSIFMLFVLAVVFYTIGYYTSENNKRVLVSPEQEMTIPNLLRLVNEERAKVGTPALSLDARLNQSAQKKADDMVKNNYFDHKNPKNGKVGNEYIDEVLECSYTNENITDNLVTENNTPQYAIESFVRSPSHYTEMVGVRYDLIGFGIAGKKVVQHFCDLS